MPTHGGIGDRVCPKCAINYLFVGTSAVPPILFNQPRATEIGLAEKHLLLKNDKELLFDLVESKDKNYR